MGPANPLDKSDPMKDEFLLDDSLVFLNHGSFGACPRAVFECLQGWQRRMEANPVEFLGRRSADLLRAARGGLAAYLGAEEADLVYVPNATTGFNIVARSLDLRGGDEIVTSDHEYGACDNAWAFAANAAGARVRTAVVPLPFIAEDFVERIWAAVTPRTRIISVSHITSTTALIFPIAALCRRARAAGILTLIDGAHAPGQVKVDLSALDADFYVGNCHKWLCAPKGAGFLHARREHHARLDAPVISWGYSPAVAGHTDLEAFLGTTVLEQRMQWQGTRDIAAYLTVPAAIAFLEQNRWVERQARCHQLALAFSERMSRATGLSPICQASDFAQMVSVPLPGSDAAGLKRRLFDEFRIEVPITEHGGAQFVRASVQAYNSEQDLDALYEALAAIFGF